MFNRRNALSRVLSATLFAVCAGGLLCAGALAQPGGGRGEGPASPELMAKIHTIEATTVAQSLSLPADTTAKLVDAYKAARASHMIALRAMQKPGERPDFKAMRETVKAETAKFETAIKAFLSPEQTATAVTTLGTFNRRWDRMVRTLDGMGLEEKPKTEAMKLVMAFVAESGKAIQAAADADDREAMRTQSEKLSGKLDTDLAKILSPDQLTKWKAETAIRGGGGRRGGPGNTPPGPAPAPETKPEPKPAAK